MRQTALVIEDGDPAKVLVIRHSACTGDCGSCASCEDRPLYAEAANGLGARAGQRVVLETQTGIVLFSAAFVYLLPLVFFMTAYFVGKAAGAGETGAIVLAGLAFCLAFLLAKIYDKKHIHRPSCRIAAMDDDEDMN